VHSTRNDLEMKSQVFEPNTDIVAVMCPGSFVDIGTTYLRLQE